MCLSSPKMPAVPALPPEPPPPPTAADPAIGKARENDRRRAALTQGRSSTIFTSAQGLTGSGEGQKKTLFGQ